MATDEQVFAWLDELCQEAQKDVMMANRLSNSNPAFAYYFANVYARKAIPPATFASMTIMAEARRWYTEYTEAEERKAAEDARDAKIADLQAELSGLSTMFKTFMEAQTPTKSASVQASADQPAPKAKNGKGKVAKDEDTEEEAE